MTPRLGHGWYSATKNVDAGDPVGDTATAVALNPGAVLCVETSRRGARTVGAAIRAHVPDAQVYLRPIPDEAAGNDGAQYRPEEDPVDVAARWEGIILAHWDPAVYHATCAICERTPDKDDRPGWLHRFAIERELGRRLTARGIPYIWLSGNTGCLSAEYVADAADLFETYPTSYHAYLGPGKLAIDADATWHAFRPIDVWLPELRKLGKTMRGLVATELGTYYPFRDHNLSAADNARLCQEINAALASRCAAAGVPYHGGMIYGFRLEGNETRWDMADGGEPLRGFGDPVTPIARVTTATSTPSTAPKPPPSASVAPKPAPKPVAKPVVKPIQEAPAMKIASIGGTQVYDLRDVFPYFGDRTYDERPLSAVTMMVQHHLGSTLPIARTVEEALNQLDITHRWHTGQLEGGHDWPAIGYHFAIDGKGRIYWLNGIQLMSYHARAANAFGVGVVWLGTFDKGSPPVEMVESSRDLLHGLQREVARPIGLAAHYEMPTNATTCCGVDHWPRTKLIILRPNVDADALEQRVWGVGWRGKEQLQAAAAQARALGRTKVAAVLTKAAKSAEDAIVEDKRETGVQAA